MGKTFDEIGGEKIDYLLDGVNSRDEIKRLIGTTRRMLDEDPQNVALRFLLACACAQSPIEADSSVVNEALSLAVQIDNRPEQVVDPEGVLMMLLNRITYRRAALRHVIIDSVLRQVGSVALARKCLAESSVMPEEAISGALALLQSNVVSLMRQNSFLSGLLKEIDDAGI
jgi:ATP-dependent DNA helicase RecQ